MLKANFYKRILCAALLAVGALPAAHAARERPRESGVGCVRAANAYCNAPGQSVTAGTYGVPPGASVNE